MTTPHSSNNQTPVHSPVYPQGILDKAVAAVPAMRYAVGVGGIGAVISLILVGLALSPITAVIGGLLVFAFMVVLFAFSRLAASKAKFKRLTAFLAWSFSVLAFACTALIVSCFFFDKPKSIQCLLANNCLTNALPINKHEKHEQSAHTTSLPVESGQIGTTTNTIASPVVTGARDISISYGDINVDREPTKGTPVDATTADKH